MYTKSRSNVRAAATAAVVLTLAGFLASCGGRSTSPRLTHDELVSRADAICVVQAHKVVSIPRGPATAINAAGYLGTVLSVVEEGVKQFHALQPPPRDERLYATFLHELDRNTNDLRNLRAAAAARDRKDYVIGLADVHRSRVRINRIERRLGFKRCTAP